MSLSGAGAQRVQHTQGYVREIEGLLASGGGAPPHQVAVMQQQRDAVKLHLRKMLDTAAAYHTHVLVSGGPAWPPIRLWIAFVIFGVW